MGPCGPCCHSRPPWGCPTGWDALHPAREHTCPHPGTAIVCGYGFLPFLALRVRHPFLGDLKKLITEDFVKQKEAETKAKGEDDTNIKEETKPFYSEKLY